MNAIQCDHCREYFHDLAFHGVEYSLVGLEVYGELTRGHYCRSCWIKMQTLLRSSEA